MSQLITAAPPLERGDIQGNILEAYGYSFAHHYFLRVDEAKAGGRFVAAVTKKVTTGVPKRSELPAWTVNLGFTHPGLVALGLPAEALDGFPLDFRQGMRARAHLLADSGESAPESWEPMWRPGEVHLWLAINAKTTKALAEGDRWLDACLLKAGDGVVLTGRQVAAKLVIDGKEQRKEHFGYTDGLANTPVAGADRGGDGTSLRGSGKRLANDEWVPIAAGEFLLGHMNEEGELAPTPHPTLLFRNGTFAVYRKLHQKVATFRKFLKEEGRKYPGGEELLAAKLVGRYRDGTPLALSPEQLHAESALDERQTKRRDTEFGYADDPNGLRCPLGAHIRRANPRDALAFGKGLDFDPVTSSKLVARRRIIRRGLPYGAWTPEGQPVDDKAEHGVIFIALNASLENQFEFIQREWMNYGGDFRQGNDPDPLVGNHPDHSKLVIPPDSSGRTGKRPHVCFQLPSFVVTRGGDYFFLPSLSALRWIAENTSVTVPSRSSPKAVSLFDVLPLSVRRFMSHEPWQPTTASRAADAWPDQMDLPTLLKKIRDDPKGTFGVLRRVNPIPVVDSFAVVTWYKDVREVLEHDDVFQVPYGENFPKLLEGRDFFLGMQDSADYRRDVANMRSVVRKDDLAKRIAPFVEQTAQKLVGSSGRLEVVRFAAGVVMAMVFDYFGTPAPSREVAEQTKVMLSYLFLQDSAREAEARTAAEALRRSLQQSLDDRMNDRGRLDDVLERCLQLQDQGVAGMTDERIIDNLFSLIVAAVPTTVAFVARATDELLRLPAKELAAARQAAMKNNLDAVAKYTFEAVRLNALGPGVFRTAAESYTVAKGTPRSTTIPKGARVLVSLQSAMLDADHFDRPHEFRIDREFADYLPFGHGLHTCFGQYINQVQLPRIVQALLRLKNLTRAQGKDGELQLEGPSPKSLWVEFDP